MGDNGTFMKIGWRYILPVWAVTFIVLIFSDAVVLNLFLILVSFLVAYLFFVPKRKAVETFEDGVLSPVDGIVTGVKTGTEGTTILLKKSIFSGCSALRLPINGEIVKTGVVHGLFLKNGGKLAEHLNENGSIVQKNGSLEIVMRIRCGLYALGLKIFSTNGHKYAGETAAHFSDGTVELLLPSNLKVEVGSGDRVVGGYTLLAHGRGE